MNLSNFSIYSQYLYSPGTWLHKLNLNYKILSIVIFFFILPYKNYIYCFISFIIYFYIFIYINVDYIYMIHITKSLIWYLINSIVAYFFYKISNKYKQIGNNIIIYFPYKISLVKQIPKITINFYLYKSPIVYLSALFFICINFLLIKILFLTTKYEEILLVGFNYSYMTHKSNNIFYKSFIQSCYIAAQCIELIIEYYKNRIISINIRKVKRYKNQYLIYMYLMTILN